MSVKNSNSESFATATFLENLKNKTSIPHKNLEDLPISKSIVDPKVTIAAYGLYLSLMHDVVQHLEDRIYPMVSEIIPDLIERRKLSLLENDLKHTSFEKKAHFLPFENTENVSIPFAMGMVYVIEGSTLGGRYILKNIQENLGFDEEKGASYFAGYGNKTGSSWKKFLQILTEFETRTDSENEIIAGAAYAFESIHKHFEKNSII